MHHIVSDGWSMSVLVREVAALYAAFSSGGAPSLPPLPVQYADFALWQRSWLQGEVLARQLDYWKQQLSGAPLAWSCPPTGLALPSRPTAAPSTPSTCRPRSPRRSSACSRQQGVTLFMTLLAAFQTLLHRYSGQEDIIVGSPIAGRTRAELEGLIGFFVNTLALRTRLGDAPSFHDPAGARARDHPGRLCPPGPALREARRGAPARARPQPLAPLPGDVRPAEHAGPLALPGRAVPHPLELESGGIAKFDLSLYLQETPEGLRGALEYNTDLFDAETVARMAGHFHTLLAGAIARPDQPLAQLPLLSEDERHQLLVGWNDTGTGYPREACLHELFEAQAARTPEAVAARHRRHAHAHLRRAQPARQPARPYLRALGVRAETPVGICTGRSLEMVVGLLGILKAGGAYVPLDPAYPPERLAFMLEDSQVTRPRHPGSAHRRASRALRPRAVPGLRRGHLSPGPRRQSRPERLARQPRLRHLHLGLHRPAQGRGHPALQCRGLPALGPARVFEPRVLSGTLAATSIAFDLSVLELFLPLTPRRHRHPGRATSWSCLTCPPPLASRSSTPSPRP